MSPLWLYIATGTCLSLMGVLSVALTLLTLPGMWALLVLATGLQIWQPNLFSWWTIIACAGLALLAEVLEFVASAAGAAKGGASKKGALAAIVGSLVGAIVGSFFLPPIGTILGAMLGAGIAVAWVETALNRRSMTDATKAAGGAAAGRLVATIIKGSLAVVVAITIISSAWYR